MDESGPKKRRVWWDDLGTEQAPWSLWLSLPTPLSKLCMSMLWSWPFGKESSSMQQTCKRMYAAIKDQQADNRRVEIAYGRAPSLDRFPPLAMKTVVVRSVPDFNALPATLASLLRLFPRATSLELKQGRKKSILLDGVVTKQILEMRHLERLQIEIDSPIIETLATCRAPLRHLCLWGRYLRQPRLWTTAALSWNRWSQLLSLDLFCTAGDDGMIKILAQCSQLQSLGLLLFVYFELDKKIQLRRYIAALGRGLLSAGALSMTSVRFSPRTAGAGSLDVTEDISLLDMFDVWLRFPDIEEFSVDVEAVAFDSFARKESWRMNGLFFERVLAGWTRSLRSFQVVGFQLNDTWLKTTMDLVPSLESASFSFGNVQDLSLLCEWFARHPRCLDSVVLDGGLDVSGGDKKTRWEQLHRGVEEMLSLRSLAQGLRLSSFAHALRHRSLHLRANALDFIIDDGVFQFVSRQQLCLTTTGNLGVTRAFIDDALAKRIRRIVISRCTDRDSINVFHDHNTALMDLDLLGTMAEPATSSQNVIDGLYAAERLERKRPWTVHLADFWNSNKSTKRHVRMCVWSIGPLTVFYGEARQDPPYRVGIDVQEPVNIPRAESKPAAVP